MPAKIATMCYIHESKERLTQDYTVKEITGVVRTDDDDPSKISRSTVDTLLNTTHIVGFKETAQQINTSICNMLPTIFYSHEHMTSLTLTNGTHYNQITCSSQERIYLRLYDYNQELE